MRANFPVCEPLACRKKSFPPLFLNTGIDSASPTASTHIYHTCASHDDRDAVDANGTVYSTVFRQFCAAKCTAGYTMGQYAIIYRCDADGAIRPAFAQASETSADESIESRTTIQSEGGDYAFKDAYLLP